MFNTRSNKIRHIFGMSAVLISLMLSMVVPVEAGAPEFLVDECWGVDHFPNPDDYPELNLEDPANQPLLFNPSWIILGFLSTLTTFRWGAL